MKLVLAEKPSVGMGLSKVLGANKRGDGYMEGGGYIVSWCIGHLIELSEPGEYDLRYSKWNSDDLPIIPEQWRYRISSGTKKQFGIIKKLMQREDVTSFVCATDAGREGELIFRLVYHQCECRKPFERLWISSLEDSAIREGFAHLKPGMEYDSLYEAALCRERADWMVGINATRLFSCLYGQTLHVGRVMTPTLAMVVMRDAAIDGFKSEPFYTVQLRTEDFMADSERMKSKQEAEHLVKQCQNIGIATVTKVDQKERLEKPPLLYDLTSLQRDANRVLGFTAQQTLDYTQSLYEKKLITYPRTDSRYLTDDMESMLPELIQKVQAEMSLLQMCERTIHTLQVINNQKVSDHHAIIPTRSISKNQIEDLPTGEKAVLKLIVVRLLCAVDVPFRYTETVIELSCAETTFTTKGKVIEDLGWKSIQNAAYPPKLEKEAVPKLQQIAEQMAIPILAADVKEGQTSPPQRFTEDTLLQSMESAGAGEIPEEVERKGIGTPATRAGIIEKLVQKGFIERKGDRKTKHLVSTHKGIALVTVVPEQIQSSSMTADWEEKLLQIERGQYESQAFMEEIDTMIRKLVQHYEVIKDGDVLIPAKGNVIGNCPACGDEVIQMQKGWFCRNKNCSFALWRDNNYFKKLGKQLTPQLAKKLVQEGKAKLKGCHSERTGRTYHATVVMAPGTDGKAVFELRFENGGNKR